jgi:hypothetical protein
MKAKARQQRMIILILLVAVGAYAALNLNLTPFGLGKQVPQSIYIKVIDSEGQGVSNALVYVNPKGRTGCTNVSICQVKCSTGSDGACNFGSYFLSGESWPIGVTCPNNKYCSSNTKKLCQSDSDCDDGDKSTVDTCIVRRIYSSYTPLVSGTFVKTITCATPKDGDLTQREPIVEVPVEVPIDADAICVMDIYPDELCSDFNDNSKSYSTFKSSRDAKSCWTSPGWGYGDCNPSWSLSGEFCSQTPTYHIPTECNEGETKDGDYCWSPVDTVLYNSVGACDVQLKPEYKCEGGVLTHDENGKLVCSRAMQTLDKCDGTIITQNGNKICLIDLTLESQMGCTLGNLKQKPDGMWYCQYTPDLQIDYSCTTGQPFIDSTGKHVCKVDSSIVNACRNGTMETIDGKQTCVIYQEGYTLLPSSTGQILAIVLAFLGGGLIMRLIMGKLKM